MEGYIGYGSFPSELEPVSNMSGHGRDWGGNNTSGRRKADTKAKVKNKNINILRPEGQASNLRHTCRSLLEHSRDKARWVTPSYSPFAVLRRSRISQEKAYTQVGPDFAGVI